MLASSVMGRCRQDADLLFEGITELCKGQIRRRLPDTEPDPIALLAEARVHLIDAHELLHAAVIRARQHHATWAAIARVLGTTRQAAQQRFTRP